MDELVRAAVEVFFGQRELSHRDVQRMSFAGAMLMMLAEGEQAGANEALLEMMHYDDVLS